MITGTYYPVTLATRFLRNHRDFDGDAFDSALVHSAADAEETVFTPLCSPTVLDEPIIFPSGIIRTVTDQ